MERALSAEIGVFGGSGFYSLMEDAHEAWIETPYGPPSDRVSVGEVAGKRVAFLPRHGNDHRFPPQSINYRANVYAMKSLGVRWMSRTDRRRIARQRQSRRVRWSSAIKSSTSRAAAPDTYYEGPPVTHVGFADPYCPTLRPIAIESLRAIGVETHERGTIVVISGPRFSTRAESKFFQSQGWEVINMTQYPECYLARELEMCYVNISLVTDYDVGIEGIPPVTVEAVVEVFKRNNERVRSAIREIVRRIDVDADCSCRHALEGARL